MYLQSYILIFIKEETMRKSQNLLLIATVFVVALGMTAGPAAACTTCGCPWWDPFCIDPCAISASVLTVDGDAATMVLPGGITVGEGDHAEAEEMDICTVAFKTVPGVESFESVTVARADTGEVVETFRFEPDNTFADSFRTLSGTADGGQWQGFASWQTEVESGAPVTFYVKMKLSPDTDRKALVKSLHEEFMMGRGAGHPDGSLQDGHFEFSGIERLLYLSKPLLDSSAASQGPVATPLQ